MTTSDVTRCEGVDERHWIIREECGLGNSLAYIAPHHPWTPHDDNQGLGSSGKELSSPVWKVSTHTSNSTSAIVTEPEKGLLRLVILCLDFHIRRDFRGLRASLLAIMHQPSA